MPSIDKISVSALRLARDNALGDFYHRLHADTDIGTDDEAIADSLTALAELAKTVQALARHREAGAEAA